MGKKKQKKNHRGFYIGKNEILLNSAQQFWVCLDLCIWEGSICLFLYVLSSTAHHHDFILLLKLQGRDWCEITHPRTSQKCFFRYRGWHGSLLWPPPSLLPMWVYSCQWEGFQRRRGSNAHIAAPSSWIVILETALHFQESSPQAGGSDASYFSQSQTPRCQWSKKRSCNSSHSTRWAWATLTSLFFYICWRDQGLIKN